MAATWNAALFFRGKKNHALVFKNAANGVFRYFDEVTMPFLKRGGDLNLLTSH